jgi:hypothetical protein
VVIDLRRYATYVIVVFGFVFVVLVCKKQHGVRVKSLIPYTLLNFGLMAIAKELLEIDGRHCVRSDGGLTYIHTPYGT